MVLGQYGGLPHFTYCGHSTLSGAVVSPVTAVVRQTLPYPPPQSLFVGVAWSPDGSRAYASGGGQDEVRVYGVDASGLSERTPIALTGGSGPAGPGRPFPPRPGRPPPRQEARLGRE